MAATGRIEIDHYKVLGLPSGERGAKLSDQEIRKAFQSKARVMHPDKRRDDPDAHADFLKLQNSYQILKEPKFRKAFDDILGRERKSEGQRDSKRQKMMSDLEEAERRSSAAAFAFGVKQSREEEERYSRVLNSDIARILARHNKEKQEAAAAAAAYETNSKQDDGAAAADDSRFTGRVVDQSKILKVSWKTKKININGDDYTAQRLREIFGIFGGVEEVVVKKKIALVLMASKDAATAAATLVSAHPLLSVKLLQPAAAASAC